MSLIIYNDGIVYADRSGVDFVRESVMVSELKKCYIPKNRMYGIASVGAEIDFQSKAFQYFNRRLLKVLRAMEIVKGDEGKIELYNEIRNNSFIVMTAESVYSIDRTEETTDVVSTIKRMPNNMPIILGSGIMVGEALMACGYDIPTIYEMAARHCISMHPTEIDHIFREELEPLVGKA